MNEILQQIMAITIALFIGGNLLDLGLRLGNLSGFTAAAILKRLCSPAFPGRLEDPGWRSAIRRG